jgi:hypothetical protein
MSLVVAFNLEDYAILASDKRGFLHYGNNENNIVLSVNDDYIKLRQIPFGFFASAGDYFITECFYAECIKKTNKKRDLEEILKDTYDRYCNLKGVYHFSEMTNIILIAKGFNLQGSLTKDVILQITIQFEKIEIEEIKPMSLVSLMAKMNPDPSFWDKIGGSLYPLQYFNNFNEFFNHHMSLIKYIWREQLKFDNKISHHIDFYLHERKTSKGILLSAENLESIPPKLEQLLKNF